MTPTTITFDVRETCDVGERDFDDAVWDLAWHAFACILLVRLRGADSVGTLTISAVRVGTYEPVPGGRRPLLCTAARIEGFVRFGHYVVPFIIRVGKGLAEDMKQLVLWHGPERCIVSLQETGALAHYRLLRELLLPRPQVGLTLAQALDVVRLCDHASQSAVSEGIYSFGTTPEWLRKESVLEHDGPPACAGESSLL